MKKLSVFMLAAAMAGLFELAAAQNTVSNKAVLGKQAAQNDTIPSKKKNRRTHRDTIPPNAPNPNPSPNPNPPNPSPSPSPSPTPPAPNQPTNPSPTTPPSPSSPSTKPPKA